MIEVQGKYNSASIFTDNVEDTAISQIQALCDQEFVSGSRIRIMPDVHAGAGCTIGTTMTIGDKIVPNLVGVDIGCGMHVIELENREIDFQALDDMIRAHIPSGYDIRKTCHAFAHQTDISNMKIRRKIDISRAYLSIGTLGGGNHFIEIDRDDDGHLYLVIHTGSRHLGLETAAHYQDLGWRTLNRTRQADIDAFIAEAKENGQKEGLNTALQKYKNSVRTHIPKDLAYVEGEDCENYLHDMAIVQQFADMNRKAIASLIMRMMNLTPANEFTTIHNYIDLDKRILRKGAVSAALGEQLLIPINMRDGSLICMGRGNDDWNQSAPHGAGRILSRTAARQMFKVEDYAASMAGIFTTSVNSGTIDECPMAYKSMNDIVDNIEPTAKVMKVIKAVYNFKAEEGRKRQKSKRSKEIGANDDAFMIDN